MQEDIKPTLDEKFFIEALNENRESIKAHVKQTIIEGISQKFKWELPDLINKEVAKFMEKEILPEIQVQLLGQKQAIVDSSMIMIQGMALEIGKAMQLTMAEKLKSSYNVEKMIKGIFGGY